MGLKLRDLYVPLRAEPQDWCRIVKGRVVVKSEEAARRLRRSRKPHPAGERAHGAYLEQAASHPQLPFLVLDGPGYGKSVHLQHVAYVLAARHLGCAVPADQHRLDLAALAAGSPLLRIPVLVDAAAVARAMTDVGREAALVEAVRRAFAGVRDVEVGAQSSRRSRATSKEPEAMPRSLPGPGAPARRTRGGPAVAAAGHHVVELGR